MASTLRLFVAAYPDLGDAGILCRHARTLDLPPNRPVPEARIHLTLLFLGGRRPSELDEVLASIAGAAAGVRSTRLEFDRIAAFPPRGPARMVAAIASPTSVTTELHRRLVQRLANQPNERKGEHFVPHITLARFHAPSAVFRASLSIEPVVVVLRRLVLMQSILRPAGAEHREVASVALDE